MTFRSLLFRSWQVVGVLCMAIGTIAAVLVVVLSAYRILWLIGANVFGK